jgi:outer membrane protein assembly factor BamE (lipoprotein component of BamABCDE complex)
MRLAVPPLAVLTLAVAGALVACTPVVNQRGYLPAMERAIKTGTDTKTTIQQHLGDPSTMATFGGDSWYYISSVEKQIAFFTPRVESRTILAIYFDKEGKVTNVKRFTKKDGHLIAFESRETPTRGRELTFLQQLLNITPGTPVGQSQEQNPGGGQGGGGMP